MQAPCGFMAIAGMPWSESRDRMQEKVVKGLRILAF